MRYRQQAVTTTEAEREGPAHPKLSFLFLPSFILDAPARPTYDTYPTNFFSAVTNYTKSTVERGKPQTT